MNQNNKNVKKGVKLTCPPPGQRVRVLGSGPGNEGRLTTPSRHVDNNHPHKHNKPHQTLPPSQKGHQRNRIPKKSKKNSTKPNHPSGKQRGMKRKQSGTKGRGPAQKSNYKNLPLKQEGTIVCKSLVKKARTSAAAPAQLVPLLSPNTFINTHTPHHQPVLGSPIQALVNTYTPTADNTLCFTDTLQSMVEVAPGRYPDKVPLCGQ